MKKQLTIIALFVGLFTASSQVAAQVEFAPIGAEWVYNIMINLDEFDPPLKGYYTLMATGDTMVNGIALRQVGNYLVYQDNHKISVLFNDSLRLIYDFGLDIGNTAVFSFINSNYVFSDSYVVNKIDTINIDGHPAKFFTCMLTSHSPNPQSPYIFEYAERIGSSHGFWWDTSPVPTVYAPEWLRCYRDSTIDYKTPRFAQFNVDCYFIAPNATSAIPEGQITLSPNPAHDFLAINTTQEWPISELSLMDMTGRVLQTQQFGVAQQQVQVPLAGLPTGMYFVQVRSGERIGMYRVAKEEQ